MTSIKKVILLSVIYLLGARAQAQETSQFNLKQCVEYALKTNLDLMKSKLDEQNVSNKINEYRSSGLPQINGFATFNDNILIPSQLVPGEIFGAAPGSFIPVKFGVHYSVSAGVDVQQLVYSQQYFTGLKTARKAEEISQISTEQLKSVLMYNVAGMYYQAQIFKVQLRLLNDNYDRVKKITEVAENQYKNDLIKKLDLDQLYVNKRNLESDIQNAEMAYQQQINGLKILMGMSLKDSLSLVTDSLQADSKAYPAEFSVQNNIAQKLLNSQLEFQELQYQTNRAGYFPSLLLNASTSINGQFDKFKFDKPGSFNRFPNILVGFTLNVPIFDGLKRSYSLKQKKIEIKKLNLDIEQTQNQLDIKYQNAVYTIDQNKIKLLQQTENLRFAQQLYDAVKFTYNEGLSGINELINAENGLKSAQNNYLASLLQIKLAELDELNIKGELSQLTQ